MCRIASVFLLQRLKRSMSGDAQDFNNMETQAVKSPPPLQGKAPKEIHAILIETFREHAPSYATVKNWVAQYKRCDFPTCDAPRPGRPKTVTTQEIIDQTHELILEDCRILVKSIAEQLDISRERIGSIMHEDLDMWKLSAKWVLKCLSADQKSLWCQSSEQLLEFFQRDPNDFLSQLVTMDETWLYHYDPETKQQSMKWWHSKCKNPLEKFSPRFFRIKTASPSFIIFQRAKISTRSITYLCWCNWMTFWRKNAAVRSPRGSCSCMTCTGSPGTCNPEETGLPGLPVSWSPTLLIFHLRSM